MRISFVIPTRNNLKYVQQAVNSIIDNYGDDHDIIILDDASTDGTSEWMDTLIGDNFIKYRNNGLERMGHTILYDLGVKLSRTDVFTIFHADMICTKNYVKNILKHLKRGTVVSATRIEPPLHPPGPEKFVKMFGFEPLEFKKEEFLKFVDEMEIQSKDKITNGIFAPWAMYKNDFESIGGHDTLFAPMELEDSDIFNRMHLAGYSLIQSRDSFVYHMTCRGSRFKDGVTIEREIPLPDGTIWYKPKDSEEYINLRRIKFREWWRKWHQNVLHDDNMLPIVNNVYNLGFIIHNCNYDLLRMIEPWCNNVYISDKNLISNYIKYEQTNTKFNMSDRVKLLDENIINDIVVEFDGNLFTNQHYNFIENLSEILKTSAEIGMMEYDIFKFEIKSLETYNNKMIIVKK